MNEGQERQLAYQYIACGSAGLELKRLNKKLSYPQRKCASNVAILYGADGISI